jgi:uncharacterized protein YceH (UPF0502 family)
LDEILFTGRELDVMAVLWTHGASTVAEVRARLDVPLAYTTVLTVLRTLEGKGHVSHESDGKAHRYQPRVARDAAGRPVAGRGSTRTRPAPAAPRCAPGSRAGGGGSSDGHS